MTQITKPVIMPITLERYIHNLVNDERQNRGLAGLKLDTFLSRVARRHSEDMAASGFFSHDTPEGRSPTDRARLASYPTQKRIGHTIYTGIAENIHWTTLFESGREFTNYTEYPDGRRVVTGMRTVYNWYSPTELAAETVRGWMNSPGHRKNILTPHYRKEGIGVAFTAERVYVTQNLF